MYVNYDLRRNKGVKIKQFKTESEAIQYRKRHGGIAYRTFTGAACASRKLK